MKSIVRVFVAVAVIVLATTASAAADANVVVTREENKPAKVEIKRGEAVPWTGATGGTAHVVFSHYEDLQFYVGSKEGGSVRFDKPGTYEYFVHISGVKSHVHRGTVVVK
jgi:plastocyanin